MSGHFREGRELLAVALERAPSEPTETRASALVGRGCWPGSRVTTRSRELLEDGLADARAVGSAGVEANALCLLSFYDRSGRDQQIRLGEEAITKARTSEDRWLLGLATGNQGVLMAQFGEIEKAIELTDEAYRLCRGVGDVSLTALWLSNLAGCPGAREHRRGPPQAGGVARARAAYRRHPRNRPRAGQSRLGRTVRGRFRAGAVVLRGGGGDRAKARALWLGAEAIWGFAHLAAAGGDADRAARLEGSALELGGSDWAGVLSTPHLDDVRAALGEQAWQKPGTKALRSTSMLRSGSRSIVSSAKSLLEPVGRRDARLASSACHSSGSPPWSEGADPYS